MNFKVKLECQAVILHTQAKSASDNCMSLTFDLRSVHAERLPCTVCLVLIARSSFRALTDSHRSPHPTYG